MKLFKWIWSLIIGLFSKKTVIEEVTIIEMKTVQMPSIIAENRRAAQKRQRRARRDHRRAARGLRMMG